MKLSFAAMNHQNEIPLTDTPLRSTADDWAAAQASIAPPQTTLDQYRELDDIDNAQSGYPRLAVFMAHQPGAALFRRFGSVNTRMLLYKQAEIMCLKEELDDIERRFKGRCQLHQSVKEVMNADPGSEGHQIWTKSRRLDIALKDYSKLITTVGL